MTKIIDPHVHLFDLNKGQYDWLKPESPPLWPDKSVIARDFGQQDLCLPSPIALEGFVHIEAGFDNQHPWREIEWLEQNVQQPFRAVAYADVTLCDDEFATQLEQLCKHPCVVGIRYILNEKANELLSQQQVIRNLASIAEHNLLFETQLICADIEAINKLTRLADEMPQLTIIINHAGFPTPENYRDWRQDIVCLADKVNIMLKASGWEMNDRDYNPDFIIHVIDSLLTLFGDRRVMLASNFPLCLLSTEYATLWQSYSTLPFNRETMQALLYDNAHWVYRF